MSQLRTTEATSDFSLRAGAVLAGLVFLTRLPFVAAGFGTDTDTWKFASSVREMAEKGGYIASRMPGYPVMEWTCTPFARFGPWAPNALSALAAAACAWLVARLFARHGVRDAWLAGAAFAFVPAAYIAGTSSIDYLWAIAFALAAWLDVLNGRPAPAGLWLGLAVGTRSTSVLFVAPLAWMVWHGSRERRFQRVLTLAGIGGAVGAAWYVPAFLRYGWAMFTYSEIQGGQVSALRLLTGVPRLGNSGVAWQLVAGQATVLLWGLLGSAALGLALLSLAWRPRSPERAARFGPVAAQAAIILVLLESILYLRLPHDEGYLLPAVPFVLLGFASRLTPLRFRALCVALVVSPFVLGIDVDPPKKGLTPASSSAFTWSFPVAGERVLVEPLRGPILRDAAKRRRMQDVARRLQAWWPRRPSRFRIEAGSMAAMMYYLFPMDSPRAPFARSYSAAQRAKARAQGIALYALPDVARRLEISEGPGAAAGLLPLAGAEEER